MRKEQTDDKMKRERDDAMNHRAPIYGGYILHGMSYMPPAVADALFIVRLFIISSCTCVAISDSRSAVLPAW